MAQIKTNLLTRCLTIAVLILLTLPPAQTSEAATGIAIQERATTNAGVERRNRGIELYRQNKFLEASELLQKAVKENKADEEAWYYLGLALLTAPDKVKSAGKAFETAIKLRPLFAAAHTGLALTFLIRNKPSDALREAKTSLLIDQNAADPYYIISVLHLRKWELEASLQNAEAAIGRNPSLAAAYLVKSQALTGGANAISAGKNAASDADRINRYARAAEALQKYLELNPQAENFQTWTEQLESLRFFGASPLTTINGERVFFGKEVTTKARIIKQPNPDFPRNALENGVSGIVVLKGVLASDGTIRHLLIIRGISNGLAEAALGSAKQLKFTPAKIDGRPVSMIVQLEYSFGSY